MKDQLPATANEAMEPRITVKIVDMDHRKLQYAQQIIRELILAGNCGEKEVAAKLKRDFDEAYGETWHCIVGTSFGAKITHRENNFLYIYCENFAVMLFKSV